MLQYFSDRLGVLYPWDKYSQTSVDDFVEGGMENTSATTLTTSGLIDPRLAAETHEASDSLELARTGASVVRRFSDVQRLGGFMAERRIRDIHANAVGRTFCGHGRIGVSNWDARRGRMEGDVQPDSFYRADRYAEF